MSIAIQPPREFSNEEWKIIQAIMHKVELNAGDTLFAEGAGEKDLYYLESGTLEVSKKGLHVAKLGPGDWVGEIAALIGDAKRTATVKAETKCVLWKVSLAELNAATQSNQEIILKLFTALSKKLADRVTHSTAAAIEDKLETAQNKVVMAEFLCDILFGLIAFLYALKIINVMQLKGNVTSALSLPLILILMYFVGLFIKKSGFPISFFGLTWKNSKKAITESLLATIPMIGIGILVKWVIIQTVPMFKDAPLFHYHQLLNAHLTTMEWLLITVGYALFVPLQALMVNGCLQTAFTKFFVGPKKLFLAIVLSNLIFSTLHLQLALSFAIIVFFYGCIWGWLYSRHGTIVGISLSHMILGIWGGVFEGIL